MTAALAVSNIAWHPEEEPIVAQTMEKLGVHFVEIAPTKVFEDPTDVSDGEIQTYLSFWEDHGISVVAFQSMLFGRPELPVFGEARETRATLERLASFIELAGRMGARRLVFGSPRNRRRPQEADAARVQEQAIAFFSEIGRRAEEAGVIFCIEPNPTRYGCDFVTTAAEGAELVRAVASPGFGLHLDAAGMALAGDESADEIRAAADILCHYHVSAPDLGVIENEIVDHRSAFAALRTVDYHHCVSIEMRAGEQGEAVQRVRDAIQLVRTSADSAGFDFGNGKE